MSVEAVRTELVKRLAEAEKERDRDIDHWTELACGQDTEEAEASAALEERADVLAEAIRVCNEIQPDKTDPNLCTIAFQSEAYDAAAVAINEMRGWCVRAVPTEGEPFDAELLGTLVNERTGCYEVELAVWDEAAGRGDYSNVRRLDIYEQIERIEVH